MFRYSSVAIKLVSLLNYYGNINFITGTHDIQNVTVSPPLPSQIRVMGDFIDGSIASGMLLIIYSLTNESDVYYIAKQAERNFSMDVTGLAGTQYGVSVFALENGLPYPRVVTLPKNVTVANYSDQGLLIVGELN